MKIMIHLFREEMSPAQMTLFIIRKEDINPQKPETGMQRVKLNEIIKVNDEELNKFRKVVSEDLTATFRKKYLKQMIRRWADELLIFQSKTGARAELKRVFGIHSTKLNRDTSIFKKKSWVKYYGTKKNGYYKKTEEGLDYVNRNRNK